MTRWYIYVLKDATETVRYVGCTMTPLSRERAHRKRFSWMASFEIVETCDDSWSARNAEIVWIQRARATGAALENRQHNRLYQTKTEGGVTHERAAGRRVRRRRARTSRVPPATGLVQASNRHVPATCRRHQPILITLL